MKLNTSFLTKNIFQNNNNKLISSTRFISTREAVERRNYLFTLEKKRQLEKVGRIEKIEIKYKGIPNDCTLIMNKDISTPYDCARHLSEWHCKSSALALLDGENYWDMHRPISQNCTLQLLNFNSPDPHQVNKAFWKTCSLVLGACVSRAFKDHISVKLHSFPRPNIRSGSFTYNVELPGLEEWTPTELELRTMSAEYVKFIRHELDVERLEVSEQLALAMFEDNQHKSQQIPFIEKRHGKVTLYRVGDHVDISKGPMINNTRQIGRVTVSAVHRLDKQELGVQLHRFQGVALPTGAMLNHFAYSILEERAKTLNVERPYEQRQPIQEKLRA